ncbi:MAG: NAD(P)H-hydrate epimerase [Firmicutes bacterium]|nr:NAD(P)H-hydrate epimerase [Bacillota bacterium]
MIEKYKKLQNGSDIRGVAIEGIEGEHPNLTAPEAACIGQSFVLWLADRLGKDPADLKLATGRDPRITGADLAAAISKGFTAQGCEVLDFGLASTPAMFMATIFPEFKCDGTVMITASHLPFNRNGFKFFTKDGGLDKKDITAILEGAAAIEAAGATATEASGATAIGAGADAAGAKGTEGATVGAADIMTPYSEHLKKLIIEGAGSERPLEGMKIVIDAGNGSGGFYATRVLEPLGADVSESQFLDPDGTFPNHAPNPENREAMKSISDKVLSVGADMGIIFDTDVDRSAAVDSNGREIARNGIVAMAAALVAQDHPGTTVVTDSITSRQLTEFLEKDLGLKHFRYRRGYRNVINKSIELNEQGIDSQLAIETSGHAALKENYFLDDGAYLATKIVIKAANLFKEGKPIDSVIAGLADPADDEEVRIPINCEEFGPYGDKVLADLEAFVLENDTADGRAGVALSLEQPNYEGVRINFPDGWCLLRKSLHDPILPLNIASDKKGGNLLIKKVLGDFLAPYDKLGLEKMKVSDRHFVTCGQMKVLEKRADADGLSYYQMMENAGTRASEIIMEAGKPCRAFIFCGKGNNGGDGFVVARKLQEAGYDVTVILADGEPKTADAVTNYGLIRDKSKVVDISSAQPEAGGDAALLAGAPDIIVDAMYGTGFRGQLKDGGLKAAKYINEAKAKGAKVFALDIPSGLGGDLTDEEGVDENTVQADRTITFHACKPVHIQAFAEKYCGETMVADIGIDEERLLKG